MLTLYLLAQTAQGGGGIDPATITGFGVAAPVVAVLMYLLWRQDKQATAKDVEMQKITERLFDYQERFGPVLVNVVETLQKVLEFQERILEGQQGGGPPSRDRR